MRLARVTVAPFAIPFRRPLVTGAGTIARRAGFILELVDATGRTGRGEASPTYWLGEENLAATAAVLDAAPTLVGRPWSDLTAIVDAWRAASPAAACALDTARLDLVARAAGVSVASQLRDAGGSAHVVPPPLPSRVPVAALLVADELTSLEQEVRAAAAEGYRTVKLKVGGRTLSEDVARVAATRAAAGAQMRIRLDANRAWALDDARAAVAAMAPFAPDFIEEPLRAADADAWDRVQGLGVALARDESIATAADYERLGQTADVLVVKAVRLGGPVATLALGRRACADGRRVVVTDAIETATGCALATQLAALLHLPDEAVGLGGARLLDPASARAVPARPWSDVGLPGLGERERGALAS